MSLKEKETTLFKEKEKTQKKNKKPGIYNVSLVLMILSFIAVIRDNLSFGSLEGSIITILLIASASYIIIYEILNWEKKD